MYGGKTDCESLVTATESLKSIARALTRAPRGTPFKSQIEWCLQHACAPMIGCSIFYRPGMVNVYWGETEDDLLHPFTEQGENQYARKWNGWSHSWGSYNPFEMRLPQQSWGSLAPLEQCIGTTGFLEGGPRNVAVFEASCTPTYSVFSCAEGNLGGSLLIDRSVLGLSLGHCWTTICPCTSNFCLREFAVDRCNSPLPVAGSVGSACNLGGVLLPRVWVRQSAIVTWDVFCSHAPKGLSEGVCCRSVQLSTPCGRLGG